MAEGYTLRCPIRGVLKVSGRSKDGLSATEEKFRIEALQYLVKEGYPVANFIVEPVLKRFGNSGRNSFRADFAILDRPAEPGHGTEWILEHALVLGEVKRDNADALKATEFQVKPMLDFARNQSCVAVYWDNVDQKVFWREADDDGVITEHEGPIEVLPGFGHAPGAKPMELKDLRTDVPLRDIFVRIENTLHAASISPSKRFGLMMQLLLAKIHDEVSARSTGGSLKIQDYRSLKMSATAAIATYKEAARSAVSYYENHLPEKVSTDLPIPDTAFFTVMSILAPYRVTAASQTVVQDFYMYFAHGLYKWDLAQYFTPPAVTRFIIDILSPEWNQDVLDPACGSADFLTATYRRGVDAGFMDYASKVWGRDVSPEAVQVAILNMVLNGDGKSNIKELNSLVAVDQQEGRWDIVVCNPPFGTRIVEKNPDILRQFDLGCADFRRDKNPAKSKPQKSQETGILFAELCVRLAKSTTGRVALVVPNGYLGNTSTKYLELRRWIVRHAEIAAVVGLPRFTFKGSGADVSASIIFLQKRDQPLMSIPEKSSKALAVQLIDNVGWSTGDKKAAPTYVRDELDGTLVLDEMQEPILLSDFASALHDLADSSAAADFPWLARTPGMQQIPTGDGFSIPFQEILDDPYLTIDPKLLSRKRRVTMDQIKAVPHFVLGDVIDFLPELRDSAGRAVTLDPQQEYQYVELNNVETGSYRTDPLRGWQLPQRAKHLAEPGDFYIGSIWGSVRKWFVVGESAQNVVVTNGMHRLRFKPGKADLALDLIAGLCSEAFGVQMRSAARGSDGLAEIRPEDAGKVVLPLVTNQDARDRLQPFVDQLLSGLTGVESAVRTLAADGLLAGPQVAGRTSHVHLV